MVDYASERDFVSVPKRKAWDSRYYQKNKDKFSAYGKEHYQKNKEAVKDRVAKWKADNPDKVRMYNASRKKAIKQATPPWVNVDDKFIVNEIYAATVALEKCTGVAHHVDHIVPIKGQNVCGLNVWWNLRPLPATENLRKKNSFKDS